MFRKRPSVNDAEIFFSGQIKQIHGSHYTCPKSIDLAWTKLDYLKHAENETMPKTATRELAGYS